MEGAAKPRKRRASDALRTDRSIAGLPRGVEGLRGEVTTKCGVVVNRIRKVLWNRVETAAAPVSLSRSQRAAGWEQILV